MKRLQLTPAAGQRAAHSVPTPGSAVIIATDLARTSWKHAVHWGTAVQRTLSTPGRLEHLQALVGTYHPAHPVLVVYEACGFGYEIAWWAQAVGVQVLVVAPSQVERAPGPRVKTDRLDARMLATKAAAGQLKAVAIPTRAQHEHRQLMRTYGQAVRARKRAQIQVRSVLQEHGRIGPLPGSGWRVYEQWLAAQRLPEPVAAAVAELRTLRTAAHASAQRLTQRLHALARTPAYAPLVAALTTHAGVAELSAMRLLLEVGDIGRFGRADSWTNYLGLTPSEATTGDGPPHRGPIRKCGPAGLRGALVQCAWASLRSDSTLFALFTRVSARAGKKRAIIAVTRRLALRLRARWLEALAAPPAAAA
jgi:transposase